MTSHNGSILMVMVSEITTIRMMMGILSAIRRRLLQGAMDY
jgi:hypothetical protein